MTEPKYPMPALTEQEREDAIKHCKSVIKGTEKWLRLNKRIGNPETYARIQLKCAHVTLAALTADVSGWEFLSTNGKWMGLLDESGKMQAESQGFEVRPNYTVPPVPVLKPIELPAGEVAPNALHGHKYIKTTDVIAAIRAAGYEVSE